MIKKIHDTYDETRPRFVIIGIGGSGCNTVHRIYKETQNFFNFHMRNAKDFHEDASQSGHRGYQSGSNWNDNFYTQGVKILGLNTDQQSLKLISRNTNIQTIQLGSNGLGAGSLPEMARMAAEESAAEIQEAIKDADVVVIVAGFGGGTGTGASPVVAEIARRMGILVIGFVHKPFNFEGRQKLKRAQEGLENFISKADTTIVLSNELLFSVTNAATTLAEAYLMLDKLCIEILKSLISMLKRADMMNIDFADFERATQNVDEGGLGMVGFGEATGADAGKKAVEMALSVPLFEPVVSNSSVISIQGASNILIHIVSEGAPITLSGVESIVTSLTKGIHDDASIKIGVTVLEEPEDTRTTNDSFLNISEPKEQKIKIVFIATGFKQHTTTSQDEDTSRVKIEHEFRVEDHNSFLNLKHVHEPENHKGEEEEIKFSEEKKPAKKNFFDLLDIIKNRLKIN